MDESVKIRLSTNARSIERFRNLSPQDQEWLFPLLSRGMRTTIVMLNFIAHEQHTFEDIAAALDLNPQTVSQKLNALADGGMAIDLSETAAYAPTGRPRKLALSN